MLSQNARQNSFRGIFPFQSWGIIIILVLWLSGVAANEPQHKRQRRVQLLRSRRANLFDDQRPLSNRTATKAFSLWTGKQQQQQQQLAAAAASCPVCGRLGLRRRPKYQMCHAQRGREICTIFRRLWKLLGYVCGSCQFDNRIDAAACAAPSEAAAQITELPPQFTEGPLALPRTAQLCSLWLVTSKGYRIPVARSYSGHAWHVTAGPAAQYHLSSQYWQFACNATLCETVVPAFAAIVSSSDETHSNSFFARRRAVRRYGTPRYEVVAWKRVTSDDTARFLEQAALGGITRWDWQDFTTIPAWLTAQIADTPPSYHRQYYRTRLNHRFEHASPQGVTTHPCQAGTRYRRYAWSDKDRNDVVEITTVGDHKVFSVDGQTRTVLRASQLTAGSATGSEFTDGRYQMCRRIDNYIGTAYKLRHGSRCHNVYADGVRHTVPPVWFDPDVAMPDLPVVSLDEAALPVDNQYYNDDPQELLLVAPLNASVCDDIPVAVTRDVFTVIGMYQGEYYIHDARHVLQDNTLDQPSPDGGGAFVDATQQSSTNVRFQVQCSNVVPNFLNEAHCQLANASDATCHSGQPLTSDTVELSIETFQQVYEASFQTRVLYVVQGLRQNDTMPYDPPCTPGTTSRWVRLDDCPANMANYTGNETLAVWEYLLSSDDEDGSWIRDIIFPTLGFACSANDTDLYDMVVSLPNTTECWQNTHRSNYQVFDFTNWVDPHPGGRDAILQFAENETFVLEFPSWHDMSRWYDQVNSFAVVELGTWGDVLNVASDLDLYTAFRDILLDPDLEGSTLVCGSPAEVANQLELGGSMYRGAFDAMTNYNRTTGTADLERQRTSIWLDQALYAPDQLRQKVAWILSQILVVAPTAIQLWFQTESFLNYYDIFVRNAFGNYRDVLKEVAYSPLMAEMLSFHNGHSTAYVWDRFRRIEYADENFAREIMQLFSIGLVELRDDGTAVSSSSFAYSNEDISEYARLWTGLVRQPRRGNMEDSVQAGRNQIDPMRINMEVKDHFPKMGLNRTYVGDHFPLCVDLPPYHFLQQGAVYRLLGTLPNPRLLSEPTSWVNDHSRKRLRLSRESPLFQQLCNSNDLDNCDYQGIVLLNETLECWGDECGVESPRIIEVEAGVYYEYTRPPCVEQAFLSEPALLKTAENWHVCADSRLTLGGVACCPADDTSNVYVSIEQFVGERVTLEVAEERCASNGLELCSEPEWLCQGCDLQLGYWTTESCATQVKLDLEGRIAIVHHADSVSDTRVFHSVREDTKTFFRADWSGSIEDFLEDYEESCDDMGCGRDSSDNLCLCDVVVSEGPVFTATPSRQQVLDDLSIGAFLPASNFSAHDLENGVIVHSPGEELVLSVESIFEVVDDNGRTQFRRNLQSTVAVGDGRLSFRNPPQFISVSYPQKRDAVHEIDAGLDHYFYHRNAAPFIAHKFLQRFGFANPSPRLIQMAAAAFRVGKYEHYDTEGELHVFGSGMYGDLAALVASILLDRETRSPVLDYDPSFGSVVEPFLLLVRLLRGLEFEADDDDPHIRLEPDLQDLIGQQSHKLPSVFSFFLPEYKPSGPVGEGFLVCPECQTMTGPKAIGLANGLNSLLKYGLDSAYEGFGFGRGGQESRRSLGETSNYATGSLKYQPSSTNTVEIIDELALVLTAGRLPQDKRSRLVEIYDSILASSGAEHALIHIQQIIVTLPEFHTNSISQNTDTVFSPPDLGDGTAPGNDYKAVINIQLGGGFDSFNMLVPHTCTGENAAGDNVREQYDSVRGDLAYSSNERTVIIQDNGGKQPCSEFALHDELTLLKELYEDNDVTFFANTGMLEESGVGRSDYRERTNMQLFAHNGMIEETQAVDPKDTRPGTGVMGRLASVLQDKGYPTSSHSIDEPSVVTQPDLGKKPDPSIVSRQGVTTFDRKPDDESFDAKAYAEQFNGLPKPYSSLFGQTWSQQFVEGMLQAEALKTSLDGAILGDHWPTSNMPDYGLKLSMISKLIQTQQVRREFFFTTWNGWDHHADMKERIRPAFRELNEGLGWLVEELKVQGLWNQVVVIISSDFGRTLTGNSGKGSDHAWGGNYFMLGGGVRGGQILGEYPLDLTSQGPLNVGRGRLIPTTSWDAVWNGVAEWMGAETEQELNYCLPNRRASTGDGFTELFSEQDLFA